MRYRFAPLTKGEFARLFSNGQIVEKSRGGGLDDIRFYRTDAHHAQGGGFFDVIRGIGRSILPFMRKVALPIAADMGANIVEDVASGRSSFKDSLKQRGKAAAKSLVKGIRKRGGRRKVVKRKRGKSRRSNKRHKKDVFALV